MEMPVTETPARPRLRANERPAQSRPSTTTGRSSTALTVTARPRRRARARRRPRPTSAPRARRACPRTRRRRRAGSASSRRHASASACASPGGATSPSPNSRTVSPSEPTSLTTTGRPWPIAVASTPDASVRRYGRTTSVASAMSRATSSSGRNPSRHSMRPSTPSSRASSFAGSTESSGSPATTSRASGKLRERAHEHVEALVRADQPEEEQRRADRRLGLRGRVELEDGMRDVRDALPRDAQRREVVDALPRVHDDAPHDVVDLTPRIDTRTRVARQRVMRRVHRRQACRNASQPANVEARQREPLHVHDVRLELAQTAQEPPHARQVLGALEGEPRARARIAREYPAADRQEELVAPIADGLGNGTERKGRREQIDAVAAARERGREAVVVRRRGARGIDDRYTHCGDDTSVSALVRNTPAARLKHALDRVLAASALVVFSPVLAADALWILARDRPAGAVRAPARGQGRSRLPDVQVPDDGAERRRAEQAARDHRRSVRLRGRRPAHHAQRALPPPHEPRRAAAALQRRARRDEPRRPACRHRRAGRELQRSGPAAPRREARHHRLGAGERPRLDPVAEALRARRVVRRQLDVRARLEDRRHDRAASSSASVPSRSSTR